MNGEISAAFARLSTMISSSPARVEACPARSAPNLLHCSFALGAAGSA